MNFLSLIIIISHLAFLSHSFTRLTFPVCIYCLNFPLAILMLLSNSSKPESFLSLAVLTSHFVLTIHSLNNGSHFLAFFTFYTFWLYTGHFVENKDSRGEINNTEAPESCLFFLLEWGFESHLFYNVAGSRFCFCFGYIQFVQLSLFLNIGL